MKRLFLVRHAKAAAGKPGAPDIQRPLTRKGVRTARDMARKVKALGLKPALFVSSPADRALETAHVFARELGYPVQRIRLENVVYEPASPQSLLGLIRRLEEPGAVVFLFGHNPALQDLAQHLVKDFPGRLPKMAVLEVDFEAKTWKEAGPSTAVPGFFDYPGREAEESERRADDLAAEIARSVEIVLERKDSRALESLLPVVEKTSRKIALEFQKGRRAKGDGNAGPEGPKVSRPPRPDKKTTKTWLHAGQIPYAAPSLVRKDAVPTDPPVSAPQAPGVPPGPARRKASPAGAKRSRVRR